MSNEDGFEKITNGYKALTVEELKESVKQLATLAHAYYAALVAEGFPAEQALELTRHLLQSILQAGRQS